MLITIGLWESPFTEEQIQKSAGFVYIIRNQITGKSYIGRKYTWSIRKVKGKKRKQKVPSNWKSYTSSSDDVNADIIKLGIEHFHFEILSIHPTRSDVNYHEIKEFFIRDILTAELPDLSDFMYYNKAIQSCSRYRTK